MEGNPTHGYGPESADDGVFRHHSTSEGVRHHVPGRSNSSGTGEGPQVLHSSGETGSRKYMNFSTSSTDRSSFELAQMSTDSYFGTCGQDKIDENPEQEDDLTSGSSHVNVTAQRVQIGDKRIIRVRQVTFNNIENNQKDEEEQREKSFTEKFQEELFVETKGYQEAKAKLDTNHVVLITGSTGEGKSFTSKKLVIEKISQGYSLKEVDNLLQWQEHVHWRKRQVVFIDDIFGLSHSNEKDEENQKLINQISLVKDEGLKRADLLYVVMTCRNSVIRRIKLYLKTNHLFQESTVVDLSLVELSQPERLTIIEKHLEAYRKNESLDPSAKQSISKCKCPVGFPYCVYMFTRNDTLFSKGKQFFNSPTEYVRAEVHSLYTSDTDVYALLAFLLIMGGEIKDETLHSLGEESVEFKLLKNIAHFPSAIQLGTRLQSALKRVDDAFVMKDGTNIQFRHSCVSEAMCFSFSQILEHVAIQWLPLEFILNYIRTDDFEKCIDDEIVIINEAVYRDLAERFINEIEIGNIFEIIKHQALSDPRFVLKFVDILEKLKKDNIERLRFILQVTEQSSQLSALLNGSLLYWTSSLNMQYLCSLLLERRFYDIIKDKFWVKMQASAALVPACWFGFQSTVLHDMLRLGADINSSIHDDRSWQTRECDYCTVHDVDGMTTIQASVFGENLHKEETIKFLLSNGASFKELSKHRPLIGAIKLYNGCEDTQQCRNIAKKTIHALLGGGVNVNWKDQNGRTALWYVVYYDNVDVVKLLVDECRDIVPQSLLVYARSVEMVNVLVDHNIDADFAQKDNDGKTLLHRVQHECLVLHFLNNGCHIGQRDKYGRTPIFYSKNLAICQKLIENGSAINTEDYDGKNVFHFIKNLEILEYISHAFPREIVSRSMNKEDNYNRTPIFTAPSFEVFRLFTTFKADVNHRAQQYSFSEKESSFQPVSNGECIFSISDESSAKQRKRPTDVYAANYIMCLPDNYSEVPDDSYDVDGQVTNVQNSINTSDSTSSSNISSNATHSIYSSGEWEEEETSMECCTVAMKFAKTGKLTLEIIKELKSSGADFRLTDEDNNTFLHYVLTPTHRLDQIAQILETVLSNTDPTDDNLKKTLVNFKNSNGNTALHLACSCSDITKLIHSRLTVVKILLNAGAYVEGRNENNETALHCLLKCTCLEKYEICQLLKHTVPDLNVYGENEVEEVPIKQLCALPEQSKRFLVDAQKTITLLYKNASFKNYFIKNLDFFLTQCNISLLETVFSICTELSEKDSFDIYRCCQEYKLRISSWVILSMIEDVSSDAMKIELAVNEMHALLRDCIEQISSRSRRMSVLKVLFSKIENINAKDDDGRSFLINAITASCLRKNHLCKLVSYFLELGVDPNMADNDGLTAFHHCIVSPGRDDHVRKCALLLSDKGANLDVGKPLLMMTDVNRLRAKCIKYLPKSILPNQKDEKGNAFHHLMIAYSKYGLRIHVSTTSMAALFGRGLDINMYNDDGETPLHVAIRLHVQSHVIMEMLRNGADVNREKRSFNGNSSGISLDDETNESMDDGRNADDGRSPFQYMFIYQHNIKLRVLKEMLKYGADPYHKDKHGQNAFHHLTATVKPNCLKVILLLLSHSENSHQNLNLGDLNGNTPLHTACMFSHDDSVWCTSIRVAIVRQFLAKGMSTNKVNNDGETPLHLLIGQYFDFANNCQCKYIHNILALFSLFLSYEVDVKKQNNHGKTVLDLIGESGNKELENLIENRLCPSECIHI